MPRFEPVSVRCAEWQERVDSIMSIVQEAEERRCALNKELSLVDQELCDLHHYVEFNDLNAAQGYRIYKRMQDALMRRRAIKDELYVVSVIKQGIPSIQKLGNNVGKCIESMDRREYAPRVLTEMFAQGV